MKAIELFENEKYVEEAQKFVEINFIGNDKMRDILNAKKGARRVWAFFHRSKIEEVDGVKKRLAVLNLAQKYKGTKIVRFSPVITFELKENEYYNFDDVNWLKIYAARKTNVSVDDLGYGKVRFLNYIRDVIDEYLKDVECEKLIESDKE